MKTFRRLLFLFIALPAFGQQIQSWRTPVDNDPLPWRYCGYAGNITNQPPTYPVIANVVAFGADTNGVNDSSTAWTNALAAAVASLSTNSGAAVYWPPGVYKVTNGIAPVSNISIRGGGETKTVIVSSFGTPGNHGGRGDACISVGNDVTRTTVSLTGGYNRGSTSLTVSTTVGLAPGYLAYIFQNADPNVNLGWQYMLGQTNHPQGQMFLITATNSATSITIDSPLCDTNWQASLSPQLTAYSNPITNWGIESLSISNNGPGDCNIYPFNTYNFWINHVRSTNSINSNMEIEDSYQGIIMHSDTWYHQVNDSTAREGMSTWERSTRIAFLDCVVEGGNIGTKFQFDCGNLCAYNFADLGELGPSQTADGFGTHGYSAHYHAFEGNIGPWIAHDDTWGENRVCLDLRDWDTRDGFDISGPELTIGQFGVFIDATNRWHSIIGNIVGTTRDVGQSAASWSLGFDRQFAPSAVDPLVASTAVLFGNLDLANGFYTNVAYTTAGTISNSVAYASKPWFFNGVTTNLAWPPIGPDVATSGYALTNTPLTPSMWRRTYNTNLFLDPGLGTQPVSQLVAVGNPVTFTATVTGSQQPLFQWKKNGRIIAGATASTYTIAAVQATDYGNYTVAVTNGVGNIISTNALLNLLGGVQKTY